MLKRPELLKDALYNANASSGASNEYSKGVFVGVVATIMAMEGVSYESARAIVKENMPPRVAAWRVPSAFKDLI